MGHLKSLQKISNVTFDPDNLTTKTKQLPEDIPKVMKRMPAVSSTHRMLSTNQLLELYSMPKLYWDPEDLPKKKTERKTQSKLLGVKKLKVLQPKTIKIKQDVQKMTVESPAVFLMNITPELGELKIIPDLHLNPEYLTKKENKRQTNTEVSCAKEAQVLPPIKIKIIRDVPKILIGSPEVFSKKLMYRVLTLDCDPENLPRDKIQEKLKAGAACVKGTDVLPPEKFEKDVPNIMVELPTECSMNPMLNHQQLKELQHMPKSVFNSEDLSKKGIKRNTKTDVSGMKKPDVLQPNTIKYVKTLPNMMIDLPAESPINTIRNHKQSNDFPDMPLL